MHGSLCNVFVGADADGVLRGAAQHNERPNAQLCLALGSTLGELDLAAWIDHW
jgi:hypothetical protein